MKVGGIAAKASCESIGNVLLGEMAKGCRGDDIDENGIAATVLACEEVIRERDEGA